MKRDYSLATTSHPRRPRKAIEVAMTPMIDVIFLLLIFFLATSSFQIVEKLLPSGVSKLEQAAGRSPEQPPEVTQDAIDQVTIRLDIQNGIPLATMNGSRLDDFAELESRLAAPRAVRMDIPVVIDPAGKVPARVVVRAYDWARMAGLSRVFLATRAKP